MDIILYSNKMDEYLKHDSVIDYDNKVIMELADTLFKKADNEIDFIKKTYEFVRDNISHSADINADKITCTASEVLKAGHGICFAKSHLLAALLRYKAIPTGFCYQELILDDETAPVLIYHGLNGVYIKDYKKWIRLDARGTEPLPAKAGRFCLLLKQPKAVHNLHYLFFLIPLSNIKVIWFIFLLQILVLDVFLDNLICYIPTACHKVSSCPQMLSPEFFV